MAGTECWAIMRCARTSYGSPPAADVIAGPANSAATVMTTSSGSPSAVGPGENRCRGATEDRAWSSASAGGRASARRHRTSRAVAASSPVASGRFEPAPGTVIVTPIAKTTIGPTAGSSAARVRVTSSAPMPAASQVSAWGTTSRSGGPGAGSITSSSRAQP